MRSFWLVLLWAGASCRPASPPESAAPPPASGAQVTLKGHAFQVRTFTTEKDRRSASEHFTLLKEGHGYLLSWPRARFIKLESESLPCALDAAFLDREGKILESSGLEQGQVEGLMSRVEAASALLLASGTLKALGARTGDRVELPPLSPEELPVLEINGARAYVELALTNEDREHGLMFRPRMSEDDGMLFVYPEESSHRFWMGNTLIPLDIAFFRADGTLLNVNETPLYPDPRHPPARYATSDSAGPCQYVLEMNLGWFKKRGLLGPDGRPSPGSKAQIPPAARKRSFD
jgi:uncharacterized membrane protein (UPF0127 family)